MPSERRRARCIAVRGPGLSCHVPPALDWLLSSRLPSCARCLRKSPAAGIAIDSKGVVYGGEAVPNDLKKYVKK